MKSILLVVMALCTAACIGQAVAAEAKPPADAARPVTTARVGGSPADAAFRSAQQENGAIYGDARAACNAKPRNERGACMNAARVELKRAQLEAKAAHDAARPRRVKP